MSETIDANSPVKKKVALGYVLVFVAGVLVGLVLALPVSRMWQGLPSKGQTAVPGESETWYEVAPVAALEFGEQAMKIEKEEGAQKADAYLDERIANHESMLQQYPQYSGHINEAIVVLRAYKGKLAPLVY